MSSAGENPFRAPESFEPTVGPDQLSHHKIVAIARYQRGVMICILLQLLMFAFQFAAPVELRFDYRHAWGTAMAILGIAGVVFAVLLAVQLYNVPIAILFGFGTLLPCLGLFVLLVINQKATKVLRKNGLEVGLLGASFPEPADSIEGQM